MKTLIDLAEVSVEEQRSFVNSFDYIFCDMDGVIWYLYKPIPGSGKCLDYLAKIGKKMAFVTNNSLSPKDYIRNKLKQANIDTTTEIVNPLTAIIAYLKSINFNRKIFAIATEGFKEQLKKEGYLLLSEPPSQLKEVINDFLDNIKDDPEVGAVIVDFDLNMTRLKLQKALTYLKRKDCLFIAGACDEELPVEPNVRPVIGNQHFLQTLVDFSGREYLQISKPSSNFLNILTKQLGIQNTEKVLVIGDSICSDMGLAVAAGCQKLLVLTGTTTRNDLSNWKYSEELKPKYYIESLDALTKVLDRVYKA